MKIAVTASIPREGLEILNKLDLAVQGRVAAKALTTGARKLRSKMRGAIPDSSRTGTRAKWSKLMWKRWGAYKHMRDAMIVKNMYRKGYVGASLWIPGLAWLEFGFENQLWDSGRTMTMPAKPIFRPTADASEREMNEAVLGVLKKELAKL